MAPRDHEPCLLVQLLKGESETAMIGLLELKREMKDATNRSDAATESALESTAKSSTVETKFNVIIGMQGVALALFCAVIGWVITQQQRADANAERIARLAATAQVQADAQRWEPRCKDLAREVLQQERESQAHDGMTVVAAKK